MRKTVKDLLVEIKDTSELIVDLAYSAILFDNEDIAEEVLELEDKIIDLLREMSITSILAARSVEDAEAVSTILQIANASQKIGNAAGDIATLVLRGFKLPKEMVQAIIYNSEETIVKAVVSEDSEIVNMTLGKSKLRTRTGMKIIAIKRGFNWIFNPDKDTKILKGDILFARGDITAVPKFFELVTGQPVEIKENEKIESNLDKAVDILIEMKNLSELAVDLSYSSVLYYSEELAQEVAYLEDKIDSMKYDLQHWVLKSNFNETKPLIALLDLANATEQIADSAKEIAEIVLESLEIHPIFREAMKETDEIVTIVEVSKKSSLDGKTLGEAKVETNTGMHVIAIKRGNKWITNPKATTRIQAGDLLIAKGSKESEVLLRRLCSK
ncbi:MAG TPA: potassium channel family protein [Archaeoglobus profundus]|nr:potassium channel family protein [Archaeoglobus profundus]HIP57754.1 potassium channel family protein [Archaeoglobus profundus]